MSSQTTTVLLVDDDVSVLRTACRLIARAGYRVLSANLPSEALRVAAMEGAVDLLVSDVMMPGMSGPELYRELERQQPGLRVVFISGYPGSMLEDHNLRPGPALFLAKPFTAGELTATLRLALSQRPNLSPVPA